MNPAPMGRTLDENGEPIPGSGFEVAPDSELAEKLRERTGPLVSNPISREWVAELEPPEDTGGEYHSAVYLSAGEGPPEHYHIGYEETFEVLSGELTVVVEGTPHRVSTGESHTVPAGTVHKPRYDGDTFAAAIGTVRPPGKTLQIIKTLFGLAHDGKLDDSGRPKLLQGMAWTKELADDSVFVSPPPTVTRPLASVLAPVGHRLGYQTTYPKYEDPEFWERHVEQPPF